MYSAPAVSYPVHRLRVQLYAIAGLWLAGAGVWLFWLQGVDVAGWRQVLTFAVLMVSGVAGILAWRQTPVGHLRWDLSTWVWTDTDSVASGMLVVHLDFQTFLLLKYVGGGVSPRWLWLERQTDPSQWLPLRRALYARHRATSAADSAANRPVGSTAHRTGRVGFQGDGAGFGGKGVVEEEAGGQRLAGPGDELDRLQGHQ